MQYAYARILPLLPLNIWETDKFSQAVNTMGLLESRAKFLVSVIRNTWQHFVNL